MDPDTYPSETVFDSAPSSLRTRDSEVAPVLAIAPGSSNSGHPIFPFFTNQYSVPEVSEEEENEDADAADFLSSSMKYPERLPFNPPPTGNKKKVARPSSAPTSTTKEKKGGKHRLPSAKAGGNNRAAPLSGSNNANMSHNKQVCVWIN